MYAGDAHAGIDNKRATHTGDTTRTYYSGTHAQVYGRTGAQVYGRTGAQVYGRTGAQVYGRTGAQVQIIWAYALGVCVGVQVCVMRVCLRAHVPANHI